MQFDTTKMHSLQGVSGMIGEPRSLSKSGFAKAVNVSPGRVSQMIAKGLPVEADGKIDVARGRLWINENVDVGRSAAQGQSAFAFTDEPHRRSLTAEKTRLAKEQADAAELRNKVLRGDLVKAGDVEREWADVLRKVRAGVLAVTSRVRQHLPHLTAHDASVIDNELRRALEEIAHDR
ncbi:DNA packaging protein [Shinella zoogloeoides]|uniref:DNA packaging protein n=1 Tax=Shinella zoogloeoides TaxID=352475 RepID=UPI001F58C88A|nr:DNA packaging protein [Shinella zoogloeoides]